MMRLGKVGLAVGLLALSGEIGATCIAAAGSTTTTTTTTTSTSAVGRFTDNGDGTVSDTRTGLMWKQDEGGGANCGESVTWSAALKCVTDLTDSGYSDWRIPNIKELASLVDRNCYSPAMDAKAFASAQSGFYWSSSPFAADGTQAWGVDFGAGGNYPAGIKEAHLIRLVRGGEFGSWTPPSNSWKP